MVKFAITFLALSALGAGFWLFFVGQTLQTTSPESSTAERRTIADQVHENLAKLESKRAKDNAALKAERDRMLPGAQETKKVIETSEVITTSKEENQSAAALAAKAAKDKAKAGEAAKTPEEQAAARLAAEEAKAKKKLLVRDRAGSLSNKDRVILTLKGAVASASYNRLRGYLYDSDAREGKFSVLLYVDGEAALEIPADLREEHKELGVIWRFDFKNPEALADRQGHVLRFYGMREGAQGRTELANSPRTLAENNYPRGRLEACSPQAGITGYAYDWDDTKLASEVVFHIDGREIATTKADKKNTEYKKKNLTPTDRNAFKLAWVFPDDGGSHLVQAFARDAVSEELIELEGSPRSVHGSTAGINRPPEGRLSVVNRSVIAGWAWDPDIPDAAIEVELWIDGEKFAALSANSPRQTLVSSKITKDPNHGFVLPTPAQLTDGEAHTVRVFAIDPSSQVLVEVEGSRQLYRAGENEAPMGGFWHADEKMLRGWAADPDLGAAACEISIYIDGNLWKTTKADRPETFVQQDGYAPNKEHGFLIVPPEAVKDGHEHEVKIYAHDAPSGPPRLLGTRTIGVTSIFAGFWTSDRELDSRAPQGLYITSVSPWYNAYHQGVLKGDVLLTLGGVKYTETAKFREELTAKYQKKDKVKITLWRDGQTLTFEIELGEIVGA